jgi:hypothetical protein
MDEDADQVADSIVKWMNAYYKPSRWNRGEEQTSVSSSASADENTLLSI